MCLGDRDAPAVAQTNTKITYFDEQRAITLESMVRYGPLSNLKKKLLKNVTKFHKILIKIFNLESGHSWCDNRMYRWTDIWTDGVTLNIPAINDYHGGK